MSRLFRCFSVFLMIILSITLISCKKEEPPLESAGKVSATRVFEEYFGPAPVVERGSCFAFVIYFPSAIDAGKVLPFPFFTFDEASIRKVALERLLGGMEVGSYKGEVGAPFPAGVRILGMREEKGEVTVDFSREIMSVASGKATGQGALKAVVLTLAQFEAGKRIRLQVEGKDSGLIDGRDVGAFLGVQPMTPDFTAVMELSPPRPLGVAATKEKGAKEVEEVVVHFDRPIEIREIRIADEGGKTFAGELYISMFDMAAILKPQDPSNFKAGMPVKVNWKIMDKMGRRAEGESVFNLELQEH